MAASVTGRMTNTKGEGLSEVEVELELVELMDVSQTYTSRLSKFMTDLAGNFNISSVYKGRYVIRFNREIIKILVPDSTGSYVVSDILDIKK